MKIAAETSTIHTKLNTYGLNEKTFNTIYKIPIKTVI